MARCPPLLLLAALALPCLARASGPVHHALSVELDPPRQRLRVTDAVTLPESLVPPAGGAVEVRLHPALALSAATPGAELERLGAAEGGVSYRVRLPPGERTFALAYEGELHDPLSEEQDYARGFRQTSGLVAEEGVFLSGASLWVPGSGPSS